MKKRKTTRRAKNQDKFSTEPEGGEWIKPRPGKIDAEGEGIAQVLSKLRGRGQTGFVVEYVPKWAKGLGIQPFHYAFFEDRLLVDTFRSERGEEIKFQEDALTPAQTQDRDLKLAAARTNGWTYLPVEPDQELTGQDIAAKLNLFDAKHNREEAGI